MSNPRRGPERGSEKINPFLPRVRDRTLEQSIAQIFQLFTQRNRESYRNPLENIDQFIAEYSADEAGILSKISELPGRSVNFDQIKEERYTLSSLKERDIFRILSSASMVPMGQEIEKLIVQHFRDKLANIFTGTLRVDFDTDFSTVDSFPVLLTRLDDFKANITDKAKKEEFETGIQNFTISNAEIKTALEATHTLDIDGRNFTDWNPSVAKVFDVMTTKLIIDKTAQNFSQITEVVSQVEGVFGKRSLMMQNLFERYPLNAEEMLARDPELKRNLEALWYRKKDADEEEEKLLDAKIDERYWRAYLNSLKINVPSLGMVLEKLYNADFDFAVLSSDEQALFLAELGAISLDKLKLDGRNSLIQIMGVDEARFEHFYQSLFDLNQQEIQIMGHSVPLRKSFLGGANPKFKSLDTIGVSGLDDLPLEFELDLDIPGISPEDRSSIMILFAPYLSEENPSKAVFSGKDLGRLMYLFFVANKRTPLTSLTGPRGKEISDFFDNQENSPLEKPKLDDTVEKDSLFEFYDTWRKIEGYAFPEDSGGENPNYGFKPGSSFWLASGTSKFPPYEVGGSDFFEARITAVDPEQKTFKFKLYGGILPFSSDKEGKEYELPMTSETLEHWTSNFEKVIKLPEANQDFNAYLAKYKASGLSDNKVFNTMHWEGNALISKIFDEEGNGGNKKVEYLGYVENRTDEQGKDVRSNVFYKVDYHSDRTITLSSEFEDLEGNRVSHTQRLSYPAFILFASEKKLKPKTKTDYDTAQDDLVEIKNKKGRKWNWWSISTLRGSVKGLWKKINSGMDEYQKKQEEALTDYLVSDVGIWSIIRNTLGFIPSIKDAANALELEAFAQRDAKVWKSIEKWLGIFTKDPDFADFFEKDKVYIQALLGKGVSLKDYVISGKTVVDNPTLRPVMAATLIAQIKAGKSPYRGIAGKVNEGVWINLLFGPAHHARYMSHRKQLLEQLQNEGADAKSIKDRLAKSEIDYILNNVRGSNGGTLMGSSGGDQTLKGLYSDAFTGELEGAYQSWTTKDEVETAYGKMKHNNFDVAYKDFEKIASGRVPAALGALLKMGELAANKAQREKVKMAMTYVLLTGALQHYGGASQGKWFETLGRSFSSFPPALLAQDPNHQAKIQYLLDKATDQRFSRETGYKLSNFDSFATDIPFKPYLKTFSEWWMSPQNEKQINGFFSHDLISKKWEDDALLKSIQDKVSDNSDVNTNAVWNENPLLTTDAIFRISRTTLSQMLNYKNGRFQGKDEDEKTKQADFWDELNKSLNETEDIALVFKTFLRWFDDAGFSQNNYQKIVRRLKTIKFYKDTTSNGNVHVGKLYRDSTTPWTDGRGNEAGTGHVNERSVKDMMRYFFVGTILDGKGGGAAPPVVEKALQKFNDLFYDKIDLITSDAFIDEVFGAGLKREDPYILVGRDDYNKVSKGGDFGFDDFGGDADSKDAKKVKRALYRETDLYINKELVDIERRLKNKQIRSAPTLTGMSKEGRSDIISRTQGR